MLIAMRSLRIITVGKERLRAPRSSLERRRYSHFLRNESESASILHGSLVRDYGEIQTKLALGSLHNCEYNSE